MALACALATACGDDGADAPVDAASCTIDGVYSATLGGAVFFQFDASTHAWAAATVEADLPTSTIGGTYTFADPTFTVVDAPGAPCPPTDTGRYSVAFDSGCDFTLTLVDDPCSDRSQSLGGTTFTFLHR